MIKYKILTYLLSINHLTTYECDKIENFQIKHNSELKNKKIEQEWETSKKLGIGSYGTVKSLNWSETQIAVKKIEIEVEDIPEEKTKKKLVLVQKEIDFLHKFGKTQNNYFPLFLGCTKDKKEKDDPFEYFIFYEKFFADLSKKHKRNFLNRNPLIKRIKLYKNILKALKLLNNNNLIHGDIKPSNLMISDSEYKNLKLIDFGMVGEIGQIYRGGTPSFNSPEKINDNKSVNHPSQDLWAFSLTIATVEEKRFFVFKGIEQNCFLILFDDECYVKLMDNVRNVYKEAFGEHSEFGHILIGFLEFDQENRLELDKGIIRLEEFILNFEKEVHIEENEEEERIPVIENVFIKNNINALDHLENDNFLNHSGIVNQDLNFKTINYDNDKEIIDNVQKREEESNFEFLNENYSRDNLELMKTINQENNLDFSKFRNLLRKNINPNSKNLFQPKSKPLIILKRNNFFKDMENGREIKNFLNTKNEENLFKLKNEQKIKIHKLLNQQKTNNFTDQIKKKGLTKDNRRLDDISIKNISQNYKDSYNSKIRNLKLNEKNFDNHII